MNNSYFVLRGTILTLYLGEQFLLHTWGNNSYFVLGGTILTSYLGEQFLLRTYGNNSYFVLGGTILTSYLGEQFLLRTYQYHTSIKWFQFEKHRLVIIHIELKVIIISPTNITCDLSHVCWMIMNVESTKRLYFNYIMACQNVKK